MAKSHPKRSYADEVRRTNNSWLTATASLIFIACLISIAIVLNRQSAVQLPAPVVQAAQQAIERVEAQQQAIEQEAAAPPEAVAATPAAPALVASAPAAEAEAGQYRALAEYVARRYRVSQEETANIVALAYGAGHGLKIDPLLILAVISVESRFNPIAESVMGAKGLMQVIPKFHLDKFRMTCISPLAPITD
jgi:soluble lytic murein transglycosylase-like protein